MSERVQLRLTPEDEARLHAVREALGRIYGRPPEVEVFAYRIGDGFGNTRVMVNGVEYQGNMNAADALRSALWHATMAACGGYPLPHIRVDPPDVALSSGR